MANGSLSQRLCGIAAIALMIQASGMGAVALAGSDSPRVVVVPFLAGDGANERQAQKFSTLLSDDLKTRDDTLQLASLPSGTASKKDAPKATGSSGGPQNAQKALETLNEGQKLLNDLKFDEAAQTLQKGVDQMLQDPAYALYDRVLDAYISIAVSYFRTGEEKKAQNALLAVVRMDPSYTLPDGKFPPVFARELEKMKRRAEKQVKGTVIIEAPMGSTAFLDGRDLGMVPVTEENVVTGMHYVKVEGTRGEKFGQPLDLKGSQAKVKAVFASAPAPAPTQDEPPPNPMPTALLDANAVYRLTQTCKAANAEYAVVGYVYRKGEHQLSANVALFSAKRQAFSLAEVNAFDDELLTANVEAFKLADQLVAKFSRFDAAQLPHNLGTKAASVVAVASTQQKTQTETQTEPEVTTRKPVQVAQSDETRKPVKLVPESSEHTDESVRALRTRSVVEDGTPTSLDADAGPIQKDGPKVESGGIAWWVWAVAGVAVVGAAGGTYYGVTQATKPVTGTISAHW